MKMLHFICCLAFEVVLEFPKASHSFDWILGIRSFDDSFACQAHEDVHLSVILDSVFTGRLARVVDVFLPFLDGLVVRVNRQSESHIALTVVVSIIYFGICWKRT